MDTDTLLILPTRAGVPGARGVTGTSSGSILPAVATSAVRIAVVEVAEGRAANRSDAVRREIARLQREQRYRGEEAVLVELARRGESIYPDLSDVVDLPHPPLD